MQKDSLRDRAAPAGNAFTLIELLIVVAIIAILAAIAIPNLLEAQVRAKVSRAKNDLRAMAVGLEAYAADYNNYPPNDGFSSAPPVEISTPIAYLTSSRLVDPFPDKVRRKTFGDLARFYSYFRNVSLDEFIRIVSATNPKIPPIDAVDASFPYNQGALEKYGLWRLTSNGPDLQYTDLSTTGSETVDRFDIVYDPTNGSISWGNVIRTQKQTEFAKTMHP